jgi:lipopolysaccharide transport system permease protein
MSELVIRSARPVAWGDLLSLPAMIRSLWRYRDLVRQFAVREVMVRHKGTSLGVLWAVVQPLLVLGIYTFIFGFVFQNRWSHLRGPDWANFPLNFFAGYLLFGVFSECVNRSPTLITEHPNLVRKVVFPLEILPLTTCGAGLVYFSVSVALLMVVMFVLTLSVPWTVLLFPIVLVPLVMLTLGVSWLFASLGAFIRDFKQVVPVLTQLMFFVTPVFYDVTQIPERFQQVIHLNPLTTIVQFGRKTLMWGQVPTPDDWIALGVVTAVGLIVMIGGYAWFTKCKRGLADVL